MCILCNNLITYWTSEMHQILKLHHFDVQYLHKFASDFATTDSVKYFHLLTTTRSIEPKILYNNI